MLICSVPHRKPGAACGGGETRSLTIEEADAGLSDAIGATSSQERIGPQRGSADDGFFMCLIEPQVPRFVADAWLTFTSEASMTTEEQERWKVA